MRRLLGSTALAACLAASAAWASEENAAAPQPETAADQEGVIVYGAEFFAASQPSTAMDMVNRLPGFQFNGGDSARGFAGTAGNVLIDGDRPTTKSDSLHDMLQRMPASQVERVELIRGGAPGIDMQGQSVVANIVRKKADSFQQVFTLATHTFFDTGKNLTSARYVGAYQSGERRIDFSLLRGAGMDDSMGAGERVIRDGSGVEQSREIFTHEFDGRVLNGQASITTPLAGGKLRANVLGVNDRFKGEDFFVDGADVTSIIDTGTGRNFEVGIHYDRPITEKLSAEGLVLQRLSENSFISRYGAPGEDAVFTSDSESGESIGRAVLRYTVSPNLNFEAGGEAALNFREGTVSYELNGVPIPLPSADVRVEEERSELFAQTTWRMTPELTLEAGSRFEWSTITQSGDTSRERSFFYPKPRVLLSWSPDERNQLRLRYEREVGQLNFGDFIASSNLTNGVVVAGNPDLAPDKSWVSEAVYERRFWDKGALVLTVRHSEIEDAIDRVPVVLLSSCPEVDGEPDPTSPLCDLFDAPGNIGEGTNDEFEAALTLPLGRLGIEGGELKSRYVWRHSEVTDPTTGEARRISGQRPEVYEANFRQDLPARKISWGLNWFGGWEETYYRFNEISQFEIRNYYSAFVEYRPTPTVTLFTELANIVPFEFDRRRLVFDGPRDIEPLASDEFSSTQSHARLYVRLRKTLG